MQDGAFAAAAATASALRSIRARRDLGGGSVSVPLATRPALGWHTATPARVRIAEPAVSRDHFLDAHFEASHAAVPGDVMADIAHRAPGAFIISLACGSIDQHWCRRRCDDERDSHASASRHHTTSFDSHRTSPIGAPCYSSRRGSGADRAGFVKGRHAEGLRGFPAPPAGPHHCASGLSNRTAFDSACPRLAHRHPSAGSDCRTRGFPRSLPGGTSRACACCSSRTSRGRYW